jgi:hypothetical protein
MNIVGFILLSALVYFVSAGNRRTALLAMVAGVLYLTEGQTIDVGINFFAVRILGIALFARVMLRHEFSFRWLNKIDRAFLTLYCYTAVIFLLRSKGADLSLVAGCIDACFCYFGFRGLIRNREDLRWLLRAVALLLIPYAFLIAIERHTGISVFAFMGGPSGGWERGGVPRCMGSFRYPVSLGTFAATFMAMYVGLFRSARDRRLAGIAIVICLWLVIASNSGGSLTAAGVALLAWFLWHFRRDMRKIRWAIVGLLAVLALIMKAPIWYVLDRVSFGGDSWHRAYLIDVALRNLDKWWFVGMDFSQTAEWFPYTVNGAADITNAYLAFGINAGLVAIVLFIRVLVKAFAAVGRALAKIRTNRVGAPTAFMVWGLGVMLGVHVITWFGVSYFDQMYVIWFLELAAVVSVTQDILGAPEPTAVGVANEFRARAERGIPRPVTATATSYS